MVDGHSFERAAAAWLDELPLEDDGHPTVVLSVVAEGADGTRITAQETLDVELRASVEESVGSVPVVHLHWLIAGLRFEHRISSADPRSAELLTRLSAQPLLPLVVSDCFGDSVEVFDFENLFREGSSILCGNRSSGTGRSKCRHRWRHSGHPGPGR